MLILDGISNPMVFGWDSFISFEILTLIVEGLIILLFIDFDKPISKFRALMLLVAMNVSSAVIAIPFWIMAGA
jgi:hypothetical protein